ncbi:MAG: PDZ domain-containing protein [Planctomycetota bacterium]
MSSLLSARTGLALVLLTGIGVAADSAAPQEAASPALPKEWASALKWRSIGPATMSGRITDLAVYEADASIWWAASASGGLLKSTNNGVTFEHQFDREKTVSIGAVAVCQSDPNLVWVGTGESNPRNSVSYGDGVYKSVDGGKTWKNMGLKGSFQIGRIAIHPDDPNVVYVGALGRLWGENEERGLFRTKDGGETWEKILYVDQKTGVVDVVLQPGHPETLLAATYERMRDRFDGNDPAKKWGAGSGLYRSEDGGDSFEEVRKGLPGADLGRISLEFYRKDPSIVFALVESSSIGAEPEDAPYMGIQGEDAEVGARLTQVLDDGPAKEAGLKLGDIVISLGGKTVHSYDELIGTMREHLAGETVAIEVSRERKSVVTDLTFAKRPGAKEDQPGKAEEPGKQDEPEAEEPGKEGEPKEEPEKKEIRTPFRTSLGGQVANVQHQQGPDGKENGGLYRSADGGVTWTRLNSINPRPMYFSRVRVDPSDEKRLYVLGVSLHRSEDGGEFFSDDGGGNDVHVDHHALWIDPTDGRHMILGNDGGLYVTHDRMEHWDHLNHAAIGQFYHVAVDSRRDYNVYGGLQDNGTWGGPSRGQRGGSINEDWISIGGGDGFVCQVDPGDPDLVYYESQGGGLGRTNLRTGERGFMGAKPPRGKKYRFNWKTPFLLSKHNPGILYAAGNYVFRSLFRGDNLKPISPEISNTDQGSATALAESPLDADVLYVGTDDGGLFSTLDGGATWNNLYETQAEKKEEPKPAPALEVAAGTNGDGTNGDGANGDGANGERAGEPADPITGTWKVESSGGGRRGGGYTVELELKEGGLVTGFLDGRMGSGEISGGRFDPEKKTLAFSFESESFRLEFSGTLEGDVIKGTMDMGGGRFTRDFEARRSGEKSDRDSEREAYVWKPIAELTEKPLRVSSLEASRFKKDRVYMSLDGHRSDVDQPFAFVSEDRGQTWRALAGSLPSDCGVVRVLREDLKNADLLYLGTEFGAYASIDRGATWTTLNTNLPTVAIHEFAQHETAGEVVVATHGRSLWALDVTPLRQLSREAVADDFRLLEPNNAVYFRPEPRRGGTLRRFEGENPKEGAELFYSFAKEQNGATLKVENALGETLREFDVDRAAGLHSVRWDLRGSGSSGSNWRAPRVEPGTYQVVLTVGKHRVIQPLLVLADPDLPGVQLWGEEYERMLEQIRIFDGGEETDPTDSLEEVH